MGFASFWRGSIILPRGPTGIARTPSTVHGLGGGLPGDRLRPPAFYGAHRVSLLLYLRTATYGKKLDCAPTQSPQIVFSYITGK